MQMTDIDRKMNLSSDPHTADQNLFKSATSENGSLEATDKTSGNFFIPNSGELERLLLTIKEPTTIALTMMYILSFVVGFVGNIMSIKVLTGKRSKRLSGVSATQSLLINLAICDLMVVCICMPITLGYKIYTAWIYGDFLCRAVPFIQATSVSASVLSLTVISVNRYYSVHSPLNAMTFFTWRKIFLTIIVVWVLSLAISMPLIFMNKKDEIRLTEGLPLIFPICREIWPQAKLKQAYNALLFVTLYCLPVAFNLTISFLTGQKLWSTSQSFTEFDYRSQVVHSSRLKTRKKIAKMVMALVMLFAVSWLPLYVADIWIDQEELPPLWLLQLRPFAQWLGLTNSSLNPICYCFIGDLYRSAKVIKTRYHQRFISFFSSSFSEEPPTSTRLSKLSFNKQMTALQEDTFCKAVDGILSTWCSHSGVCHTTQVSLHLPPATGDPRNVSDHTSL